MRATKTVVNAKGFTLTETVLTVAIIGALTAVAVPSYGGFCARSRVRGVALGLVTELASIRTNAISQNMQFRFSVVGDHGYEVTKHSASAGPLDLGVVIKQVDISNSYPGVTLSATGNVTFRPYGTSSPMVITVENAQDTRQVQVNIAGHIKSL